MFKSPTSANVYWLATTDATTRIVFGERNYQVDPPVDVPHSSVLLDNADAESMANMILAQISQRRINADLANLKAAEPDAKTDNVKPLR